MARLKLKQILSNLYYDAGRDQLKISSSLIPAGDQLFNQTNQTWNDSFNTWEVDIFPALVISGSVEVADSLYQQGTITIDGIDSFGDSGSFYTVDLGTYDDTANLPWIQAEEVWENSIGTWDGS